MLRRPDLPRLLAPLLLILSACGGGDDTETGSGDGGPGGWPHDFSADLIGGGIFDAGDYEGQDLVLWFWAPW